MTCVAVDPEIRIGAAAVEADTGVSGFPNPDRWGQPRGWMTANQPTGTMHQFAHCRSLVAADRQSC